MNVKDIITVKEIVKSAAQDELLPRFAKVEREHKTDGSIVTEADYAVHNRLIEQLSSGWPEFVILSEEMTVQQQQQALSSGQPVWCLDPLDGTSNFAAGIPYFAVSLSLIQEAEIKLGLVYDPLRDECFFSQQNAAAELNNKTLSLKPAGINLKQTSAIIDFKRLSDDLACRIIKEKPFSSQRNYGASALDWCWLAAARGHLYLHGKQNIWDYSAGYLIFKQAGGYACTVDAEPVFTNTLEPRSVLAATDESLFLQWKQWIAM